MIAVKVRWRGSSVLMTSGKDRAFPIWICDRPTIHMTRLAPAGVLRNQAKPPDFSHHLAESISPAFASPSRQRHPSFFNNKAAHRHHLHQHSSYRPTLASSSDFEGRDSYRPFDTRPISYWGLGLRRGFGANTRQRRAELIHKHRVEGTVAVGGIGSHQNTHFLFF